MSKLLYRVMSKIYLHPMKVPKHQVTRKLIEILLARLGFLHRTFFVKQTILRGVTLFDDEMFKIMHLFLEVLRAISFK